MTHVLENAIITIAVLCIFIIPIIVISQRSKKKKQTELTNLLSRIARKNRLVITQHDVIGNRVIGFDEDKQTILFIDDLGTEGAESVLLIDLEKVRACSVFKNTHKSSVTAIQLHIKGQNNQPLHVIPFYKQYHDNEYHVNAITDKAEKWKLLIENSIVSLKLTNLF